MTLESYSGIGYRYFIYDTRENQQDYDHNKICMLVKNSFGEENDGIMIGPMIVDGKIQAKQYDTNGEEMTMDEMEKNLFEKFLLEAGYEEAKAYQEGIEETINTDFFIGSKIKLYKAHLDK